MRKKIIILLIVLIFCSLFCESDIEKAEKLSSISNDYYENYDFYNAMNYEKKAYLFWIKTNKLDNIVKSLYNQGLFSWHLGKSNEALGYFKEIKENYYNSLDDYTITILDAGLGSCYHIIGDYNKAMKHYFRSLYNAKEYGFVNLIARNLNNLGYLEINLGKYDNAYIYFEKALEYAKENNLKRNIAQIYNNLSIYYLINNELTHAKSSINKTINIYTEINEKKAIGIAYYNLGDYYAKQDSSILAKYYYQKSIEIFSFSKDRFSIANAKLKLAMLNREKNEFRFAKEYLEQCRYLVETKMSKQLQYELDFESYKYYKSTKDYKKAYQCFNKYCSLRDSIFSEHNLYKITDMEMDFICNELDEEYKNILKINSGIEQKMKAENNIFFIMILLFMIGITLIPSNDYIYKSELINKIDHKITNIFFGKNHVDFLNMNLSEQINIVDEKFKIIEPMIEDKKRIYNRLKARLSFIQKWKSFNQKACGIVHKLKGNVNLLNYKVDLYHKYVIIDEDKENLADIMNKMSIMIDRINNDNLTLTMEKHDLNDIVKNSEIYLKPYLNDAKREITVDLSPGKFIMKSSYFALQDMFSNLIINAIQATECNGKIKMKTEFHGDTAVFSIEDNGYGIPVENYDKIWSAFFTTKPNGKGLGLVWVKKVVELHDAEISFNSEVDVGTTFFITFKKNI